MWKLTLRSPEGKPREYTLKPGKTTIGRRQDNDIVITDISASRRHAELEYDPLKDAVILNDTGSTNGTFVNRERVTLPTQLTHNDVIRIGEHVIDVIRKDTHEIKRPHTGTHPLTRDILLESIDQHAVLLYEVARKLNTVLEIDTALHEVSRLLALSLGADRCEVVLAEQFNQLSELGFPESIAHTAIERKSTVIIPDMSAESRRFGHSASLMRIRSAICVPMISGDQVIGLIYMYKVDPTERAFDERDMQLAVAISHQAALTVQRMHLLERVREEQRVRQLLERFLSSSEADFILKSYLESGKLPELAEQSITVLFADIADSTGLAERLKPKRFGEILSRYYQEMSDIIFEYGGLVDKYLGDGIMAVFGMTGDRSDPEIRAVNAGLRLLNCVETMNKELEEPLVIGIGVNTGMVVAGYVETNQRVELAVLGDTVNVASGLQAIARPNRLVIGPATVAAVVGQFNTRRVGAITVKGRTRDIQAHEVLRVPQDLPV